MLTKKRDYYFGVNMDANPLPIIMICLYITRVIGGKRYFLTKRDDEYDIPSLQLGYGEQIEEKIKKIVNLLGDVELRNINLIGVTNSYSNTPHTFAIRVSANLYRGEPQHDKWIWGRVFENLMEKSIQET